MDGELAPYDQHAEPSPIFGDTVHCVQLSDEGLVYVCDRMNHRLQIFEKDGTFVREGFVGKETAGASTWDIAFSTDPDQTYIYNADGGNHLLWTVRHDSLETLGTTGRRGRMAGQFEATHSVAVDSQRQRVRRRDAERPPRAEVHAGGHVTAGSDRPARG